MTTVSILAGLGGGFKVANSLRFRATASAYLNRTPSVAGNRQKFTISAWLKRGTNPSTGQILMAAGTGTLNQDCYLCFGGSNTTGGTADTLCFFSPPAGNNISLLSTSLYRDFSAWYHVVVAVDTTQATASNRVLMYVNGVQITSFTTATYPTLNQNLNFNNTTAENIGTSTVTPANFFDGYFAEFNYVDGQQLAASSFGTYDTNGVWQPINYSGTYGTNGFHLTFGNTSSVANLGLDSSGNGNTWTVNNVSLTAGTTYDSMTDSPTVTSASVANYAVLNPLALGSTVTLSNGNLQMTEVGTYATTTSTIAITSGKWYAEMTAGSNTYAGTVGIAKLGYSPTSRLGFQANTWAYNNDGGLYYNSSTLAVVSSYTTGDVIGVAFDATNLTIAFYKNNVLQGTQFTSGNSGLTAGQFYFATGHINSTSNWNFGQQPFIYTPPTGFNALNTYNLPSVTIPNGALYMAVSTWTGAGTTGTGSITNGGNNTIGATFQPDFVWAKARSQALSNALFNSVVGGGAQKGLISNATNSEASANFDTTNGYLSSFDASGFSYFGGSAPAYYSSNGTTYVGWQWKANGTGSSNTNGSITSTVSANTTAGFSIVSYTGTGANATVGHGLGAAPNLIITKNRDGVTDWWVYHSSLGATQYLVLDSAAAAVTSASAWNNTAPTSSVFSLGAASPSNANRDIAYCWTAVAGFSAFGSYTGNASTDGPFVYCGFRPRFVLLKNTSQSSDWFIVDTSRNTSNAAIYYLEPDNSTAEASGVGDNLDFLSNGFKIKTTNLTTNGSGNTIIYAAFAENPFNSSRAR
jgi:hypothetical protein